jgi:hypothetical protein
MQRLTLDAVLGANVDVDVCTQCRAFWFEPFETIHLTPASTMKLFTFIADRAGEAAATSFPTTSHCPKCGALLLLTHDRQRNTGFQYWRCDAGHGRFTPFADFLREKDFIRPLSPQQVAELRQSVQTIHCANCGAPIDLTRDSLCSHCGAALSMLDMKKMADMAKGLEKPGRPPATLPHPARERSDIGALFTGEDYGSLSLVDLGLKAVAKWLGELVD